MEQSITIPANIAMVPVVRHRVLRLLTGFEQAHDAVLVATELVTNAIRRSTGEITIRVRRGDGVRIEVSDQRGQHPRTEPLPVEEDAPDGLALVSALARWIGGSRARNGDCTTWATLVPVVESPPSAARARSAPEAARAVGGHGAASRGHRSTPGDAERGSPPQQNGER